MRRSTSKVAAFPLVVAACVVTAALSGCGAGAAAGAPVTPGATIGPTTASPAAVSAAPVATEVRSDLASPRLKEIAMELVSSAENSTLDWKTQYGYIQDIGDGRGYTAGLVGFCSGTGDMLGLVRHYTALRPHNVIARYLPALENLDGSASHDGLDPTFVADWHKAAEDPLFRKAQDDERDSMYFDPAVDQAKADGLNALGQFIYYDAMVMHGQGDDPQSFGGIRAAALRKAKSPAQGGDERRYLAAFLDARRAAMKADPSHQDTTRVDTEQRAFLQEGNLMLALPLRWSVSGDGYAITR